MIDNFVQNLGKVIEKHSNTPGSRGGPGDRDRKLAVKRRKNAQKSVLFRKKMKIIKNKYLFLDISSSYAKILGGKFVFLNILA